MPNSAKHSSSKHGGGTAKRVAAIAAVQAAVDALVLFLPRGLSCVYVCVAAPGGASFGGLFSSFRLFDEARGRSGAVFCLPLMYPGCKQRLTRVSTGLWGGD